MPSVGEFFINATINSDSSFIEEYKKKFESTPLVPKIKTSAISPAIKTRNQTEKIQIRETKNLSEEMEDLIVQMALLNQNFYFLNDSSSSNKRKSSGIKEGVAGGVVGGVALSGTNALIDGLKDTFKKGVEDDELKNQLRSKLKGDYDAFQKVIDQYNKDIKEFNSSDILKAALAFSQFSTDINSFKDFAPDLLKIASTKSQDPFEVFANLGSFLQSGGFSNLQSLDLVSPEKADFLDFTKQDLAEHAVFTRDYRAKIVRQFLEAEEKAINENYKKSSESLARKAKEVESRITDLQKQVGSGLNQFGFDIFKKLEDNSKSALALLEVLSAMYSGENPQAESKHLEDNSKSALALLKVLSAMYSGENPQASGKTDSSKSNKKPYDGSYDDELDRQKFQQQFQQQSLNSPIIFPLNNQSEGDASFTTTRNINLNVNIKGGDNRTKEDLKSVLGEIVKEATAVD